MTALRRTGLGAAWAAVALIVVALLAQPGGPLGPLAFAAPSLVISGDVTDMAPGVPTPLTLTLENPASSDVLVREVRAEADGAASTHCPAESLSVAPWRGELVVPAQASAQVSVTVTAPGGPACSGLTWMLRYEAD